MVFLSFFLILFCFSWFVLFQYINYNVLRCKAGTYSHRLAFPYSLHIQCAMEIPLEGNSVRRLAPSHAPENFLLTFTMKDDQGNVFLVPERNLRTDLKFYH